METTNGIESGTLKEAVFGLAVVLTAFKALFG
jgi:hypothetical protein